MSSSARDADKRILVEHLVEVAHPEEDDGAGILALCVLVLPHRWRQRGWRARGRGDTGFGGYRHSGVRRVIAGPARGRVPAGVDQGGRVGKYSSPRAGPVRGLPGPETSPPPGRRGLTQSPFARVDFVGSAVYNGRDVTILALDTSTHAGSVALRRAGTLLGEHVGCRRRAACAPAAGRHPRSAARLPPCRSGEVSLFAVASGPGAFTGLRIGIATIQGLAFAHGRPVVGVSALEAIAHAVRAEAEAAGVPLVAAWMDAARGEVFTSLFEAGADGRLACVGCAGGRLAGGHARAVAGDRERAARAVCRRRGGALPARRLPQRFGDRGRAVSARARAGRSDRGTRRSGRGARSRRPAARAAPAVRAPSGRGAGT